MPTQQVDAPASNPIGASALHFTRPPETLIDLGGARIAYRRIGAGPDVLFVHGWPLNSATFRDIAPALADRFTCHLFDLPGAGFSEWDADTPISIHGHADTVLRVARALDLERYAIVAHDSGAAIGRFAAARDPQRVVAMVMGNTEIPGHVSPNLRALMRTVRIPGGKRLFRLALGTRWIRRTNLGLGTCFSDPDLLDGDFHELFIEPLLRSERAFAGAMAQVSGSDHLEQFEGLAAAHAQLPAPVQLIWGAEDPWFPLAEARKMMGQFPGGCELHVLPSGKVFAHEEFPDAFVGHALPFLERAFAATT